MKHCMCTTKPKRLPEKASMLETQQKASVLGEFASVLDALGEAVNTWLEILGKG